MPTRHRSHELETESQRAFEGAMPSNLVIRPVSDDYGVDREVEVFDGEKTTGLTFKVQLKGTDKSGNTRRIKREHIDYWLSLDVPVLLVSYEARTQVLRGRWVHSVDMDPHPVGTATITVHMDPTIGLDSNWAANLADDLRLIRAVRRGEIPSPMPLRVDVDNETTRASKVQVKAALLRSSRRTGHPMSDASPDSAAMTLRIARTRIQCSLPLGLASSSLQLPVDLLLDAEPAPLAELGLALAATALVPIEENTARAWAMAVSPESPWWEFSDAGLRLIPLLAHPESATTLLAIHAALTVAGSPTADQYSLPLLDLASEIPTDEFKSLTDAIEGTLTDDADGGRRAFNLGQLHKARRDHEQADRLLKQAGAHAPRYYSNSLYMRHRGECAWELGHYSDAAEHYRAAIDLGGDPHELLPLLADSLMWAGAYDSARQVLIEWAPKGDRSDRMGLLRGVMLDHFAKVGLTKQDRGSVESLRDLLDEDHTLKPHVTGNELLDVIRNGDALHPAPWVLQIDPANPADSFEATLIAAVLIERSPHVWATALVCSLAAGKDSALTAAIIDQARYHSGNDFYDAVIEVADRQAESEAPLLRELVGQAWLAEAEAFEHHWRSVDFAQSEWIIEDVTVPGRPLDD